MKKRFWAFALMVVMLISIFPVSVLAEENKAPGTEQKLTIEYLEEGKLPVYHSVEKGKQLVLYCFNSELKWPSTTGESSPETDAIYTPDDLMHLDEYGVNVKDKIYRILYAGYPHNNLGLYSLMDDHATYSELLDAVIPPKAVMDFFPDINWEDLNFTPEKLLKSTSGTQESIVMKKLSDKMAAFDDDDYAEYVDAVQSKIDFYTFLFLTWEFDTFDDVESLLEAYDFYKVKSTPADVHDATQIAIWRILYENHVPNNNKTMEDELALHKLARELVDFANGVGEYKNVKIPPRDITIDKIAEYQTAFNSGSKLLRADNTPIGAGGNVTFTKNENGEYISEALHFDNNTTYEFKHSIVLKDGENKLAEVVNYGTGEFRLITKQKPSSGVVLATADDKFPSDVYQYIDKAEKDVSIDSRKFQDMSGVYYENLPMSFSLNALFSEESNVGSLVVKKTVEGYPYTSNDKEFAFKVTLSDSGINGDFGPMRFVDGVAEFTLKDGHYKHAENLPAEIDYTVEEDDYSGDGFVTTFTGNTGKIQKNKIVEAVFVNTYDRAVVNFKGNKTLNGRKLSEGEFSFTITDGRNNTTKKVKNAADGTIDFGIYEFADEGEFNFTVKEENDGKKGVTYDGKEYNIKVTVTDDGTGKLTATITGITSADDINFTNSYKEDDKPDDDHHDDGGGSGETSITRNGSLTISKNVTGDLGDKNKLFTFHVAFNTDNYYAYTGSKTGVIKNGGTLQLKDGESITINGIPSGVAYAIVESDNAGYRVYKTGDAGIIVADQTLKASFTNTKSSVPQTGDNRHLFIWMGIMAISFIGCIISLVFTIRKRESHE